MSLTYGFGLGELGTEYNSKQFSDAFRQITGDGVCVMGGKLAMTISGFVVNLSTGYVMAAGRWVENDEPLLLRIPPSGNYDDRFDAVAVYVDEEERKATLEILSDADPSDPPDGTQYLIRVKRGATTLTEENVTDLRRYIVPMSEMSPKVLQVYRFLTSGIDQEVERLIALSEASVDRADAAVEYFDAEIQSVGGVPGIGELRTALKHPVPEIGWLLCNGGAVPEEFSKLSAMLDGELPDIPDLSGQYKTYIYGGLPQERGS